MEIVKLDQSRKIEYNEFLQQQSLNTFLQAWEWGDWQTAQGKIVERYFFMDGKTILGSAQVILMRIPLGNYFYCPYGPIWKPGSAGKVENQNVKKFITGLTKALTKERAFFLRIEPIQTMDLKTVNAVQAESVQPPQTLLKNISEPEEELLKSFHHKTRYNIKVAQKHEVTVENFSEVNESILDLIMQTSERQNYRNHTRAYIKQLWQFFNNAGSNAPIKATGYLACKDRTPLAAGLMIDFAKTRMYLFGGSNYEQRALMGPYLMHWHAILDAKASGYEWYDFGASENASGHKGGYTRFKMGFAPKEINFTGTHDIIFKRSIYSLYRSLRRVNRLVLHLPFRK